jgi:hypothetical protein
MQQDSPETDPFMHPPGYTGYDQYGYQQQSGRTNTLAILGFVLAFVFWPAGLVLSILGIRQARQRREGGHGLAVAGVVISAVAALVTVLSIAVVVLVANTSSTVTGEVTTPAPAPAVTGSSASPGQPLSLVEACSIIMPAATSLKTATNARALEVADQMDAAANQSQNNILMLDVHGLTDLMRRAAAGDSSVDATNLYEASYTLGKYCGEHGVTH